MSKEQYNVHISDNGGLVKAWTKGVFVEEQAVEQLRNTASMPFIFKHVAAMPDVHYGLGATVGSVVATKRAIIPAAVGVDIGCLDKDTEYLTTDGWKKITEWSGEDVLQFDPVTGTSKFVTPLAYIKKPTEWFYHMSHAKGLDQKVCDRHKMLIYKGYNRTDREYDIQISEDFVAHQTQVKKPSVGFLATYGDFVDGVSVDEKLIRIHVMVCADGRIYENGKCELHFKKERKINRAKELLTSIGIVYTESTWGDDTVAITFIPPFVGKSLWDLGELDKKGYEIVCDEVVHWDGTMSVRGQRTFCSTNKDSADFVQHAFAAIGIRAGIVKTESKENEHWSAWYQVYETKNKFVNLAPTKDHPIQKVKSEDGFSYCFTVPSGFFVARRNDNIFVTGNCGMLAAKTSLTAKDLPDSLFALRTMIESRIPVGFDQHQNGNHLADNVKGAFNISMTELLTNHDGIEKMVKNPHDKVMRQCGTLGGGNHFIELCLDENDDVWIMLHSGSRGIGNIIGRYFIEKAKEDMRVHHINLKDENLSYLSEGTQHFDDYWKWLTWSQEYARLNREVMFGRVVAVIQEMFKDVTLEEHAINCHHNYTSRENHFGENVLVTRKGAVSAKKGELGIIPGSMGTKSFIVRGKGNKDSFHSCSHGAGRVMSRKKARQTFTVADHVKATEGVECKKGKSVLDETPKAYKDIEKVMDAQSDLVDIVHTLKQVLCIKG